MKVQDIMSSVKKKSLNGDIFVHEEESIDNAALLMKDNKLDEIPVVNDDEEVVGKVTRDNIIENSDEINENFFLD